MSAPPPRAAIALVLALSLPVAVATYNHLGEDAYISFRYAANLAGGHGLVFNIGEREEGYSNLLWVVLMAVAEFLGARQELVARILSIASLMGLSWGAWRTVRALGPDSPWSAGAAWLAAVLGYQPLLRYHADRGLETVAIACSCAGALLVLAARGRILAAGVLAAATTLLRPEGVGFALALVPVAWVTADGPGRDRLRRALAYAAWPLAAFAAQMLFRRLYHGEWLPNTVVAKRHGEPGAWRELATWVASSGFTPMFAIAGAAWALRRPQWRALGAGVLCVFFACAVFQFAAGRLINEGWRYIAPAFPSTAIGVWLCVVAVRESFPRSSGARWAGTALLLWSFVLLSEQPRPGGAPRLFEGNRDALRSRFHVRLAEFARRPDLPFLARWYVADEIFLNAEAGRWVRANLPQDALIAGDQLGQLGFFSAPTQRWLDLLGLMDRKIAKNGATPAEIIARNPDYFVVLAFSPDGFWPAELRGRPMVPSVRSLLADPEIAARWHPSHMLVPRETLSHSAFQVWRRGSSGENPKIVEIGVTDAEFRRS